MNFIKICSDILKSDSKIRFVGVLDSRGNLISQKIREDSISLVSNEELKMIVYYTIDRWNRLQNLQHKLGKVNETTTKYENVSTITLFLDKNLFLISTDPKSNNAKISSNSWKIIQESENKNLGKKKSIKRKPGKKKSIKRKPGKKKSIKRKPGKK